MDTASSYFGTDMSQFDAHDRKLILNTINQGWEEIRPGEAHSEEARSVLTTISKRKFHQTECC